MEEPIYPLRISPNFLSRFSIYLHPEISIRSSTSTQDTYLPYNLSVAPLFPFGYGLSYTEFEYSDIEIGRRDGVFSVSFTVKNVGKCAGAEVSQVYVGDVECSVLRPAKELKGFEKISLEPGETKTVTLPVTEDMLSFYGLEMRPLVEEGYFTVMVGSSSDDKCLKSTGFTFVK